MTESLRVGRSLGHPPARVWTAFTDPAALAAWFWPQRFATTVEADVRVGGRFRIDGPGAGMAVSGDYVAVDPPTRLVFTWRWDGEEEETLVTVQFTATATGTDLLVVHDRFTTGQSRDQHEQGWHDCLDRLPVHLHEG